MQTKTTLNTLEQLCQLGQSPWYDNIDRRLLRNGALKGFIDSGITGLTSNPSIFQKAVAASDIYNEQIGALSKEGKRPKEIYDEVTVSDVRDAADLLKDTYLRTNGIDGYVSIEVYPEYAHDAKETYKYARMIHDRIKRDNIMIKVPGTEAGLEAVRSLVRDGISVNVTLLFSLLHYEKAASAYIDGLRDRLRHGKGIDKVASVASVFISRVDARVDKMLDDLKRGESLKGRIAVSNAKMIYQKFKELFGDKNFGDLAAKGGCAQRPLWASTSTKDPSYSDVKYIEELIGNNTINTIPHATMEAYLDHGKPRLSIEEDLEGAREILEVLSGAGIDIWKVCQDIQDAGLDAFQASFDKLIDTITR